MPSPVDYVFTRDYLDNNRVNLQHHLWIKLFGYLLHPNIPAKGEKLRIADVGTGTAIWLTDLATQIPQSVQLDGLDVSFDAAPPRKWLPSNVTLKYWDVKDDVPEELMMSYDIVHIRTFSFVLQDHEIITVLENLIKLLKPGGYLQWGEPDVASFRIETSEENSRIVALRDLLTVSRRQDDRLKPTWVPNLAGFFETAGLEMIESDVREAEPHLAMAKHECGLMIHELIARKTQNKDIEQKLKELIPKACEETRLGAYWAFTRWTVIGRKPIRQC